MQRERKLQSPPREAADPPLRAIVVDDEEPARRLVREYLASIPGIEIVAECANGFEAVKAVGETDPDLLLLDIQMPKLDGFEVLELLERAIPVIFITAYDEFALRAFEVHAVDYLLKPFTAERLAGAIRRARTSSRAAAAPGPDAALVRDVQRRRGPLERILVRDGSRVLVIPAASVVYIEAQDDYVQIAAQGRRHLKQQTLNDLEGLLDPGRFVRIHRSFLLNLEFLQKIERYAKDSRIAVLQDGSHLPVSRSGYSRLRQLL